MKRCRRKRWCCSAFPGRTRGWREIGWTVCVCGGGGGGRDKIEITHRIITRAFSPTFKLSSARPTHASAVVHIPTDVNLYLQTMNEPNLPVKKGHEKLLCMYICCDTFPWLSCACFCMHVRNPFTTSSCNACSSSSMS